MRPEYDFSQAVRGKHAARFAVSPDEPPPAWFRDAIRYDRQAWISEALRRSQELEAVLVAYLTLAFHLEPEAAGRDVSYLVEDPKREVLRRINEDLETRSLSLTVDLRNRIEDYLRERSWLVHRSLHHQVDEESMTAAKRIPARLRKLSSDASALTEQLWELILARFVRSGMTQVEFEQQAESVIDQWLAA